MQVMLEYKGNQLESNEMEIKFYEYRQEVFIGVEIGKSLVLASDLDRCGRIEGLVSGFVHALFGTEGEASEWLLAN
jgi:hypothetical protein